MKLNDIKFYASIKSLKRLTTSGSNKKVFLVITESELNTMDKYFHDGSITESSFQGVYKFLKMKLGAKMYMNELNEEEISGLSVKSILQLKTLQRNAIVDLTSIPTNVWRMSRIKRNFIINNFVSSSLDMLIKRKFSVEIIFIVNPLSKTPIERTLFASLASNEKLNNLPVYILGKKEDMFKVYKTNFNEEQYKNNLLEYKKLRKFLPTHLESEADKKVSIKELTSKMDDDEKIKKLESVTFADDMFTDLNYTPSKALGAKVLMTLGDTDAYKDLYKYDKEKFQTQINKKLLMEEKLDTTVAKVVLAKPTSNVVKTLSKDLPDKETVSDVKFNYQKKNFQEDIKRTFTNFENDLEYPLVLKGVKFEDTSNDTSDKETVRVKLLDSEGKEIRINVDLPKLSDDGKTYFINGNKYFIVNQLLAKPISKVKENTVALTTNYAKTFMTRYGGAGRSRFTLDLERVSEGDDTLDLPSIDYDSTYLTNKYVKFKVGEFNYNLSLSSSVKVPDNFVLIGSDKKMMYLLNKDTGLLHHADKSSKVSQESIVETGMTLVDYLNDTYNKKELAKTIARVNILGSNISVLGMLLCNYSFINILDTYGIKYKFFEKGTSIPRESVYLKKFELSEGDIIVIDFRKRGSTLLLNPLIKYKKTLLDVQLVDLNKVHRNLATGILDGDNSMFDRVNTFLKLVIDPITKKLLEDTYGFSDPLNAYLLMVNMLVDNSMKAQNDFTNYRIRNQENVASLLYKTISTEYAKFKGMNRNRVVNNIEFNVPKEKLMNDFVTTLPNVNIYSHGNISQELEDAHKLSFAGHMGINSDDSIGIEMRELHPSQRGIIDPQAINTTVAFKW